MRECVGKEERAYASAAHVYAHAVYMHGHGGVSMRARVRLRRLRLPWWTSARPEDRLGLHYMDWDTVAGVHTTPRLQGGAAMVAGLGDHGGDLVVLGASLEHAHGALRRLQP